MSAKPTTAIDDGESTRVLSATRPFSRFISSAKYLERIAFEPIQIFVAKRGFQYLHQFLRVSDLNSTVIAATA